MISKFKRSFEMSGDSELTIEQKVTLIAHTTVTGSFTRAIEEFEKIFEKPASAKTALSSWKKKLLETESLMDKPRSSRPSLEESKSSVIHYATKNSNCTQREMSRNVGVLWEIHQSIIHNLKCASIKLYRYT